MALALSMTRAKTGVFFLSVYQNDGTTPQDLSGTTLYFHANVDGIDIDKSSPASGITIQTIGGGADCATLQIEPSDTTSIPDGGVFEGPCELTLGQGSEAYELNSGTLTVSPNVGTP